MYTSLETLPHNVIAALDEPGRKLWMAAYNKSIQKNSNNHTMAVFNAWDNVKSYSGCRYFAGFVSSDKIDKQNDSVLVEKAYEKVLKQIERGGTIVDTHSNRVVGSFYHAIKKKTPEGNNGIYAYGVVYQGEPYFNTTWDAIKKAVECPNCGDVRKGFSIGGFALETQISCDGLKCHRDIIDLSIHEISVCHDPANPDATINEVNLFAKADISGGKNMEQPVETEMKQTIVDPRAAEAVPVKSEDMMVENAEEKAESIEGAEAEGLGALQETMDGESPEGLEDEGVIPTVDEIKRFKKHLKNLDRIIREVNGIRSVLTAAEGKVDKIETESEEAKTDIQETVADMSETPVEKGLLTTMASGDIPGMLGLPGQVAGAVGAKASAMETDRKKAATEAQKVADAAKKEADRLRTAKYDGTSAKVPEAGSEMTGKIDVGGSDETIDAEAKDDGSVSFTTTADSGEIGKAKCGCGMDSDVHTSITAKKCPMPKDLYGDIGDPAKPEFLENKEHVDKPNPVKNKKEEGLVDAYEIKGKKTAEEGPAVETKEDIDLPKKVMSKAEDGSEIEDTEEEDVEDMEKAAKNGAMTEEQFKKKYVPKPEKTSFKSGENRVKGVGKEGKEIVMKCDGKEIPSEVVEVLNTLLEEYNLELKTKLAIDNDEIEDVIEKPEMEVTDEEITTIIESPEEMDKAEALGKMSMFKFRARMTESRINLAKASVIDILTH